MAGDKHARTEKPTAKRLKDARKKGQVAQSRDLAQAGGLAAAVMALGWAGSSIMERLGQAMSDSLGTLNEAGATGLDAGQLATDVYASLWLMCLCVAPIAVASAVASVATHAAQNGWVVASEAMQFDWSRLNPVTGMKKLGLREGGLNTVKMLVAVSTLVTIGVHVVMTHLADAIRLGRLDYFEAVAVGWGSADRVLKQSALALVVIALLDYGMQRWKFLQSMKMTKQEVREDTKMTEGNPEIKSRVRRVQREMQRRRMINDTKRATVVITNPTEYAVALEYDRARMVAPLIVAKGRGLLAGRIRAVARDHGIPIVENVALAQALYRGAEVGDAVPGDLFEAVAGVLAYLIRLKQLVL